MMGFYYPGGLRHLLWERRAADPLNRVTRLVLFSILFLSSGLPCITWGDSAPSVAIDLLYATNRTPSSGPSSGDDFDAIPGALTFGTATVVLDADDDRDSSGWPPVRADTIESGWVGVEPFPGNDLADLVNTVALHREDKTALVYVHGFMKSFPDAVRDLGSIVYGANYRGVPIVFSWPAGTSPLGYEADTRSLVQSIPQLSETLAALSKADNLEKVHLVAHSMGNQALLAVLMDLATSRDLQGVRLGELILYAPDVDRAKFMAQTLPLLNQRDIRPTLYVAEFDVPLISSRVVNKGPRLGDADAGFAVAAGMDTIDVTPVAKFLDRHNHHLTRASQADVAQVLQGLEPAQRANLKARETDSGQYWQIIKTK